MDDIAKIAAGLSEAQRAALEPCAVNRTDLPKDLIRWHTKPGHRFPSPRLSSIGYVVRDYLRSKTCDTN